MEYIEVTDETGKPTGETKIRSCIHREGDWHIVTEIWIINSKHELLIQKRSAEKESYPNLWDASCAGHIPSGEEPLKSAVRELKEELGIIVKAKDLKYLFEAKESQTTNGGSFINNEIKRIYLFEKDIEPTNLKLQKKEVGEVKLINYHKLEKLIKENPKDFVPHTNGYKKLFKYLKKNFKNSFSPKHFFKFPQA